MLDQVGWMVQEGLGIALGARLLLRVSLLAGVVNQVFNHKGVY